MADFDVFLSYNRKDAVAVEKIAFSLRQKELRVWFDQWELTPGVPWRELAQEALSRVPSTAIFIGPEGLGAWEKVELDAVLDEQVARNCRVIPVLLPGAPEDIKLPPFLHRNTWVRFHAGLDDQDALFRLRWGICGEKPAEEPLPRPRMPTAAGDPVHQAATRIVSLLASGNVTYFVGSGAHAGGPGLPSAHEISMALLRALNLPLADQEFLVPPLDLAGSYYEIKEGDLSLENTIVDLIRDRPRDVPPTHRKLARLLLLLQKRPRRRIRVHTRQLVVTTNLDLMMERALLQEGISFTRIVQDRSEPRIVINRYDVKLEDGRIVFAEDGRRVRLDDHDEIDERICTSGREEVDFLPGQRSTQGQNPLRALPLQGSLRPEMDSEAKGPILYKPQGSQDVPSSCAISLEQYFNFLRETVHNIPKEVRDLVENDPILFLGYSFLDPEFRLLYHTLLRDRIKTTNRLFACQLRPEPLHRRWLEASLWEELKNVGMVRGVATIEARGEPFLDLLCGLLQQELERAG